ncbi:MAG: DUF1285 domain-containing protein [Hellea sp.]|nr:DUF1285 domain-containing protein [Hellea sp.]
MVESLKSGKEGFDLADLIKAAKSQGDGSGERPVEKWNPEYCGEMDMVIKADGSWWHDGTRITRQPLVKLFASILRKDEDGETYLVTPVEKIKIEVERSHFIAIRVDVEGQGEDQRVFFTTNMDEIIEAGPERPIRVEIDPETQEPSPFVRVRGRLEAILARPVFYELVEHAVRCEQNDRSELGIYAGGTYFPLGNI